MDFRLNMMCIYSSIYSRLKYPECSLPKERKITKTEMNISSTIQNLFIYFFLFTSSFAYYIFVQTQENYVSKEDRLKKTKLLYEYISIINTTEWMKFWPIVIKSSKRMRYSHKLLSNFFRFFGGKTKDSEIN